MAERVGFEPTLEFPLNTLSKRAPSATRPSLRRNPDGKNHSSRNAGINRKRSYSKRLPCFSILWVKSTKPQLQGMETGDLSLRRWKHVGENFRRAFLENPQRAIRS